MLDGKFTVLKRFSAAFMWQEYTRTDWTLAASIWAERRRAGRPIGDADLLIGIFARNRDAVLVTDNERDFLDLGVTIQNWTVSQS
jgi:predicted nucleic acid-binding protein